MSDITQILDTLERRTAMLSDKCANLMAEVRKLQQDLQQADNIRMQQAAEIESLKKSCDTLKNANALLGSEDYKRETKLKINSLIREIDYCISQLQD